MKILWKGKTMWKLTQEEIENLDKPTSNKEIEFVVKTFPQRET